MLHFIAVEKHIGTQAKKQTPQPRVSLTCSLLKGEEFKAPWLQVNVIQWQMERNGSLNSKDLNVS